MHHADFAGRILREIDDKLKATEAIVLNGSVPDWVAYQKASSRRAAFLEVRELIVHGLDRDEAR